MTRPPTVIRTGKVCKGTFFPVHLILSVAQSPPKVRQHHQQFGRPKFLCGLPGTDSHGCPHKKNVRMKKILEFCKEPRTTSEILDYLGLSDRKNLMETYLNPMLEAGMLAMTEPETPTSRNQKYKSIDSTQ